MTIDQTTSAARPILPRRTYMAVAAVNDDSVLHQNLLRSPDIVSGRLPLLECRDFTTASLAYNYGLENTKSDIVLFVHQDVYLPENWLERVDAVIDRLQETDPNWAVLGVFGVTKGGHHIGHVWCSGLQRELNSNLDGTQVVRSVDELAFFVRGEANCGFDSQLPDWHLYGTDIILDASLRGLKSYVADIPVIHNTRPIFSLAGGYTKAYLHMRRKWKSDLPIFTTVVPITRFGVPLWYKITKMYMKWGSKKRQSPSILDPKEIARRLGFEIASE